MGHTSQLLSTVITTAKIMRVLRTYIENVDIIESTLAGNGYSHFDTKLLLQAFLAD